MLLGGSLALAQADQATLGVVGPYIERAFHVGTTQIGLLASAFGLVAAVGTIPAGVLTDRIRRTWLLAGSLVVWAAAMVATGAALSFVWMFASRMALGVTSATARPTTGSLVGDLYPGARRGRFYGLILSGEVAGVGVGFVLAGIIAAAWSWRGAFWILAVPSVLLAVGLWKMAEPARRRSTTGGRDAAPPASPDHGHLREAQPPDPLLDHVREAQIAPRSRLVLHGDPSRMNSWQALRYVLSVPSNLILIASGVVGDFFFAVLRTFAVIFLVQHYGLSLTTTPFLVPLLAVGAVGGTLIGGRAGDALIDRGMINGRIMVAAVGYTLSGIALLVGASTTNLFIALPLFTLGTALLTGPGVSADTARLDIVHPQMWGRAEAVRTMATTGAYVAAPALFGYLASSIGVDQAVLWTVPTLIAGGLLLLLALRTYPRDVASVIASVEAEA